MLPLKLAVLGIVSLLVATAAVFGEEPSEPPLDAMMFPRWNTVYQDLPSLVDTSAVVVIGVLVKETGTVGIPPNPDTGVYTEFEFEIGEAFVGAASGTTIRFLNMGGLYNNTLFSVADAERPVLGEEYLLFLKEVGLGSHVGLSPAGGPQGTFAIREDRVYSMVTEGNIPGHYDPAGLPLEDVRRELEQLT